jgi:hypothetical protein
MNPKDLQYYAIGLLITACLAAIWLLSLR